MFRNVDCSEEGYGQGKELVGVVEAERTAETLVAFEADLPIRLEPGETLTCTATAPDGTTSPFSNCIRDTGGCELPFLTNESHQSFVANGSDATLEAMVTGSEPIVYQWYARDDRANLVPVPGATGRTYLARRLTASTDFKVTATNACGETQGGMGVAVCAGPPVIETQPVDFTSVRGEYGRVAVAIPFGTYAMYQWYEGRRGDTSHPLGSPYASLGAFVVPHTTASGRYWCRLTNACGSTDSDDAAITVVEAMRISSVTVKGSGAKAKIVAKGSSIPSDAKIFVPIPGGAASFEKAPKVSAKKLTQKGRTVDGRSIDEAIPPGATTSLRFVSSRGSVVVEYQRP